MPEGSVRAVATEAAKRCPRRRSSAPARTACRSAQPALLDRRSGLQLGHRQRHADLGPQCRGRARPAPRRRDDAAASAFAGLVEPGSGRSRYDAIFSSGGHDQGEGVVYRTRYAADLAGRKMWVEDAGRWFAGIDGRPASARGVLRLERAAKPRNWSADRRTLRPGCAGRARRNRPWPSICRPSAASSCWSRRSTNSPGSTTISAMRPPTRSSAWSRSGCAR